MPGLDTMVMDSDETLKESLSEAHVQEVKGFQPLQMIPGPL